MAWTVGNAIGTLSGLVLGGYFGTQLGQGGFWIGGLLVVYLLATIGAVSGGLVGGLVGVGIQRNTAGSRRVGLPWGRVIGSVVGTTVGIFAGCLVGGVIKSLCYSDGPEGWMFIPFGGIFGGMAGTVGGGMIGTTLTTTKVSGGKLALWIIAGCGLGYLVLAVLANMFFS